MSDLVLHIGLPKTGTSTLQAHVFPDHPEVVYLGKVTPGAPTRERLATKAFSEARTLMTAARIEEDWDAERMRALIPSLIGPDAGGLGAFCSGPTRASRRWPRIDSSACCSGCRRWWIA